MRRERDDVPALMVQGCSSWAGKSLLTTALCRWFARRGVSVAPFKAQNMSNNARVTTDGGEIGAAQWLQSRAAGVTADVRMNPVLLKPEAGGSQVVRLGQTDDRLSRLPYRDRSRSLWPTVENALADLLDAFDLVVIEGAGSPAEINLADVDIVNMHVAERAGAPVLLVVDIDRGGAFAHLYGTWSLVADHHRARIAGFVLNRFRGDATLLAPAPAQLERLTGVPTIGVLPMLDHRLPDEDGAALHAPRRGGRPRAAVLRYPTASNLDEFTALEEVADVVWVTRPADLHGADLVVLPGSKHVTADLTWMLARSLDGPVRDAAASGTKVLGICGGLQLLGERLETSDGVDGSGPALGLLPVSTTFARRKRHRTTAATWAGDLATPWSGLAGRTVTGYEIRHGTTHATGAVTAALPDGLGWARGNVLGVYLHGLLEDPDVLDAVLGVRPEDGLERTFDLLADAVDEHLDTTILTRLAGVA